MKIKCSIKAFGGRKGFTLIELLVVVLIIGLLAAVALPQYNKAVKKTQGAEVLTAINALDKAVAAHVLENANANINTTQFDIKIPSLRYFKYQSPNGSLVPDFVGIYYGDGFVSRMISNSNDAQVSAKWDFYTGKRFSTTCEGANCTGYFDCNNVTESYCLGPSVPVEQCPTAIGTKTVCYINF